LADEQIIGTIGIMAGIPEVPTAFMLSLRQMEAYCRQHMLPPGADVKLAVPGATDHALARNEIVDASEGEWTLFLDCDHYVEASLLHRLILTMYEGKTMTKAAPPNPVVTGLYFKRRAWYQDSSEPRYPQLYAWSVDPEKQGGICPVNYLNMLRTGAIEPGQPFIVEACGGGCLLVHRTVFERIDAELGEKPFDNSYGMCGRLGEDVAFCWRCRQLGVHIVCQPAAESYHREEHYLRLSDIMREEGIEVADTTASTAG